MCPPPQVLLHAVSSGKGFRMSIVLCNHKPVVEGYDFFDREVWVAEEVWETLNDRPLCRPTLSNGRVPGAACWSLTAAARDKKGENRAW